MNTKQINRKIKQIFLEKQVSKLVFTTIQNTRVVINESDVALLFAELNDNKNDIFLQFGLEEKIRWCKMNIDDKKLPLLENAIILRGRRK